MTHLQPQRRYHSPMRFKGGGGCDGGTVGSDAVAYSISANVRAVSSSGGVRSSSSINSNSNSSESATDGVETVFNTAAVALDYCSNVVNAPLHTSPSSSSQYTTLATVGGRRAHLTRVSLCPNRHDQHQRQRHHHHLSTNQLIPAIPSRRRCRPHCVRQHRSCWLASSSSSSSLFCVQHFLLLAQLLLFACGGFLQVAVAEPYGGSSSSVGIHIPGGSLGVISESRCPRVCSCNGLTVDCSHRGLTQVPRKISADVERLHRKLL
ncbi:unnamed protein product [Ceratitis capitata]|uniref:(Mediterranean fruit fly) hypothetical protein n=1 Tax=Ceratitis capitata TaxID=7213 RepID=A0A811VBP0_CERCA|nr:unnamed protein product [Ceratitis capitata]